MTTKSLLKQQLRLPPGYIAHLHSRNERGIGAPFVVNCDKHNSPLNSHFFEFIVFLFFDNVNTLTDFYEKIRIPINEECLMPKFSKILRSLRNEQNLSQKELAYALGVNHQLISRLETGFSEPNLQLIIEIADFFKCSSDYLLGRENEAGAIIIENENSGKLLSDDEKKLVDIYRQLTSRHQYMTLGYISGLLYEQKGA